MCHLKICSCCVTILAAIFGFFGVYQPPQKEALYQDRRFQADKRDTLPETRILIVGTHGSGKSATGNTILGYYSFPVKIGGEVTKSIKLGTAERFQRKLVVVDTPGLFNTGSKTTNEDILKEISKCYAVLSPGIHAIVLVIPIGKITDNIDEAIDIFLNHFGHEAISVLIVVFTFKDYIDLRSISFDSFIKSISKKSRLSYILQQVGGRYLAIGYKGKTEDREEEVKQLLEMIDKNVKKFSSGYYSNEMFENMERYLSYEEKKIRYKYPDL